MSQVAFGGLLNNLQVNRAIDHELWLEIVGTSSTRVLYHSGQLGGGVVDDKKKNRQARRRRQP